MLQVALETETEKSFPTVPLTLGCKQCPTSGRGAKHREKPIFGNVFLGLLKGEGGEGQRERASIIPGLMLSKKQQLSITEAFQIHGALNINKVIQKP